MTRRKSVCFSQWTLVLLIVLVCPCVFSRPQEIAQTSTISISTNSVTEKSTEDPLREASKKIAEDAKKKEEPTTSLPATQDLSRNVKNKGPVIGDSIKMVASQLLENPSNNTGDTSVVHDTRIPPKVKNQINNNKHKNKRHDDGEEASENAHAGIAVPVTMEDLESENHVSDSSSESSTSNEGISTWILLSNPNNVTTEPTKIEEPVKKQKPNPSKNKTKRPQNNKVSNSKRPIIGSTNKSDLVAGGSAINENVYNKIKDTVLSNVQKNKNTTTQRTTTTQSTTTSTTTTVAPTEPLTTKKEVVTKAPSTISVPVKISSKPTKKKNKHKQKTTTTTTTPTVNESALLPMEPKEQEIELEISTPPTTTKKPKRTSNRKKTKTKKRKPKPETASAVSEIKTSNKTKSHKTKKPGTSLTGPITSQIYSYFSREVMPSAVGVGVIGLASLVGLAGYFLYPFATPVRRTFEVDKKDDIYRHNAEEYANEGNGQAEEEMLGTVLAGMPAHSKQKLNPYAGQTTNINRYPVKKEQDIRYRHVATKYEPNYNVHYPQQKTGIAHAAVYAEPINYNSNQYETRHVYTTESKYVYDKGATAYTPHPAVEPIYASPQTGPSGLSSYGSDASNSVVYGVKPASDSEFKPVYPFEGQFYQSEVTTSSPMTYPPMSMYLGSSDEKQQEENEYSDSENGNQETIDNKFVVGNVPKELAETATPAVVPEHGPRNINRKRRFISRRKRSISGSIEQILKEEKEKNKDIFLSNEIDEVIAPPLKNVAPTDNNIPVMAQVNDVYPVYTVSVEPLKHEKTSTDVPTTTIKNEIVESVSTVPIDNGKQEKTTTDITVSGDTETTTKTYRIYEVFSTNIPSEQNTQLKSETTTQFKNMNTETTTEIRSETTSTMPPSPSPVTDVKLPTTITPAPTNNPEVLTYPPLNQEGGFFTFLKRLIEFKYRLGLSILQTTSENLNRYLRSMENTAQKVASASKPV